MDPERPGKMARMVDSHNTPTTQTSFFILDERYKKTSFLIFDEEYKNSSLPVCSNDEATHKVNILPTSLHVRPIDDPRDPAYKVTASPHDNPYNLPRYRKWIVVVIVACGALCTTSSASIAAPAEGGIKQEFNISDTLDIFATLSIHAIGLGVGPLFAGPLSEVYGRSIIYRVSFLMFFAFSWPVAFAPNVAVYALFRFLTAFFGSAFLAVAGGTVSDMFPKEQVSSPMALFTLSPLMGPAVGSVLGGFINQHANWRWTFHTITIWTFVQLVAIFTLVPETYVPTIVRQKAERLRRLTDNRKYWTEYDEKRKNLGREVVRSLYTPFLLLLLDRMALLLDTWTALLLGTLYLAFEAFPLIFGGLHGFTMEQTGMTFIGIGLGSTIACASQPLWNRHFAKVREKHNGNPPPEVNLAPGKVGGILVALSLFWVAITSYSQDHWIAPIIGFVPFGAGIFWVFSSVFTYLVTAYRPIAASAMSANNALRSVFASAFPLFASAMYSRLGPVGAMALIASLATLMVPLPFVFSRIGARLRAKSRFAA